MASTCLKRFSDSIPQNDGSIWIRKCLISNGTVAVGIRVLVGKLYVVGVKYSLSCLGGGVYSSAIFFLDSFVLALIFRRERSISGLYSSRFKHKERLPYIQPQRTKRIEWNHHNYNDQTK